MVLGRQQARRPIHNDNTNNININSNSNKTNKTDSNKASNVINVTKRSHSGHKTYRACHLMVPKPLRRLFTRALQRTGDMVLASGFSEEAVKLLFLLPGVGFARWAGRRGSSLAKEILSVYPVLSKAHVTLVWKVLEGGHKREGAEITKEKK
jgi:hypothetical protein